MAGKDRGGSKHVPVLILGALFLSSGALGLVDEVVWFRLLFLRLGGTGLSVATVTAAFMTGLGIGAWLFGRMPRSRLHPVAVYGLLEVAIGVYAALVPWLIGVAEVVGTAVIGADSDGGPARMARFLMAGIVLVPPTVAMGATLPVLARLVEDEGGRPGRFVGLLYGLNTVGAVCGAGVAGFYLLPRFGLTSTLRGAALASVLIGVVALIAARRGRAPGTTRAAAEVPAAKRSPSPPAGNPGLAITAYAVSGLVAFSLQVSWTRILALVFASSVYAFALILVIFLTGLGVGGLAGAQVGERLRSARRGLAWCFLAISISVLLGQGLVGMLPDLYLESLIGSGGRAVLSGAALLAAALMLPPTFLLGAGFPLAVRLATGDRAEAAARRVGGLYAANTAGSVVGAFLAALYLIPTLGLAGTVTAAALLAGGMALVLHDWSSGRVAARVALPATAAVVVALWGAFVPPWNPLLMSNSVAFWGSRIASTTPQQVRAALEDLRDGDAGELLFYRDGVTATVSVVEQRGSEESESINRYITSDGKVDASSVGDMPTQILSGQVPMFLHPDPPEDEDHDVLIIGLASGVTAGTVLLHDPDSLDIAEIEPAMVEAYAFFDIVNREPLLDERTNIVIDDARAWLRRTSRRYDVIISEPSSAWLSGPAKMFTREAFTLLRDRLKPGGLLCQWLQTYDLDAEAVSAVLRTLATVFDEVHVFRSNHPGDLLLMASDRPVRWRPAEVTRAWAENHEIEKDLRLSTLTGPCGIAELLIAENEAVRAVVGEGPLNTDDNALVEHRGPRTLASGAGIVERLRGASRGAPALLDDAVSRTPQALSSLATSCLRDGATRTAASLAAEVLKSGPDADALWVTGEALRLDNRRSEAVQFFAQALGVNPAHGPAAIARASTLQAMGRYREALNAWDRAAQNVGENALVLSQRGATRLGLGDASGAVVDLERAASTADRPPVPVEVFLARALQDAGREAEGRVWLEAYASSLTPREARTPAGVAAVERLGRLVGPTSPRGRQFLERAAETRVLVVPGLLRQARSLLGDEGEAMARVYLSGLCDQDPALQPALVKALGGMAEAGDERLLALLQEMPSADRPIPSN